MNRDVSDGVTGPALWAGGINVLVGLWLVASSSALRVEGPAEAATVGLGLLTFVMSASLLYGASDRPWVEWVVAALGLALMVVPWLVTGGTLKPVAVAHNVVVGAVVAALGAWAAVTTSGSGRLAGH